MALEGKIIDFGVADILQLISQQQKTGVLLVERGSDSIEVLFWNGMIVSAHPVAKDDKELLGERLVRSGLVTESQLQRALTMQRKNRQHIGEVLVEMNIMTQQMMDRIIHNQIYDTFSDLFQWKDGRYVFQPSSVNFNEKLFTPMGFEHIILDVLRMIDEWPILLRSISSLDAVFKKNERFDDSSAAEEAESTMTRDQKMIFNLLDGRSSAEELAQRSLLGKFVTVQALRTLLDSELIERVEKENRVAGTARTWQHFLGKRLFAAGWYGVLVVVAVSLLKLSTPDIKTIVLKISPLTLNNLTADINEHNKRMKLINALQIYYWEQGSYPQRLEALVESALIKKHDLQKNAGNAFSYSAQKRTYTLD